MADMIVMTKENLSYLATELLAATEEKIGRRIVTAVNDSSDDLHVPSAKAVNTKIKGLQNIVYLTIESGDPSEAEITPSTNQLYAVRTSEDSDQFVPYLWINEEVGFIPAVGSVTEDSSDLSAITRADITAAVNFAAEETAVV